MSSLCTHACPATQTTAQSTPLNNVAGASYTPRLLDREPRQGRSNPAQRPLRTAVHLPGKCCATARRGACAPGKGPQTKRRCCCRNAVKGLSCSRDKSSLSCAPAPTRTSIITAAVCKPTMFSKGFEATPAPLNYSSLQTQVLVKHLAAHLESSQACQDRHSNNPLGQEISPGG